MPQRLVDPRLVKVRAGGRGSGWAIGTCGVLTALHVVAAHVQGEHAECLLVPGDGSDVAFDAEVIWSNEVDLALLAVVEPQRAAWQQAIGPGQGPALGEVGIDTLPAEAIGYPDATVEDETAHPEVAPGRLLPAGGAVSGRIPFDVDNSVPDDSAFWKGMSGAAIKDRHGRLRAVLVAADQDRQQRRLYVRPLPDPTQAGDWAEALRKVGAAVVLEAASAPEHRALLTLLDGTGRPYAARDVMELDRLGARRARTDVELHGDPYYPYVVREIDEVLRGILTSRLEGRDCRMLVVDGSAMSGKSRSLIQAIQTHATASGLPLLVPSADTELEAIIPLVPSGGAVLWLGDVDLHVGQLDRAAALPGAAPGLLVVGTVRTDVLSTLQEDTRLRSAWDVLNDDKRVERVTLPSEWSEEEQRGLSESESLLSGRVREGTPLGEVLGAAHELRARLAAGSPKQQAVVYAAVDWRRTGMTTPLPPTMLGALWRAYLPKRLSANLASQQPADQDQQLEDSLAWARRRLPGLEFGLVELLQSGLVVDDFLVASREAARPLVPTPVWESAFEVASTSAGSAQMLALAETAYWSDALDFAERGWRNILQTDRNGPPAAQHEADPRSQVAAPFGGQVDVAAVAALNLGLLLARQGDVAGARAADQRAIDSRNADVAPKAAFNLGLLLEQQGDLAGAQAAWQQAIDSRHPSAAPPAAFRLALLLEELRDLDGASAAYRQATDSDHPEAAPAAAVRLGALLENQGDLEGARAAYQRAIDSGHHTHAPQAAVNLGGLLEGQGQVASAKAIFERVLDSGHVEVAPKAAFNLGVLLQRQSDSAGARAAYQQALDGGDPESALSAAVNLGPLLVEQHDLVGARAAWQRVIDSGQIDLIPMAAFNLGMLLEQQGDLTGARAAWEQAVGTGHVDAAPRAALLLGLLLQRQGDPVGAGAAYQRAIVSGHPEYAPGAALSLGLLLHRQRKPDGARTAYQQVINSRHAELAPRAAFSLGVLLEEQSELDGARAAYQQAIDSGHPEQAPAAANNLARLLFIQGDWAGGWTAWQYVIDSGHANGS